MLNNRRPDAEHPDADQADAGQPDVVQPDCAFPEAGQQAAGRSDNWRADHARQGTMQAVCGRQDGPASGLDRILVYTHNSIGVGHAVRTMAVIDGMRRMLPETDFLVLSGGSTPDIFLSEGVETVKLPGLRHDLDLPGHPFRPRYFRGLGCEEVSVWRSRLIAQCLESFRPVAVLIEHSLAGLMGEAAPLLAGCRTVDPDGHILAHLSRGIYRSSPMLLAPAGNYPGLPPGRPVTALYDAFYVLEDRTVVDVNQEFFGADPDLEARMHYLGRIAAKNPEELLSPEQTLAELNLQSPLVLASLGRHGPVVDLHERLFAALGRLDAFRSGMILVALDPYLSREQATAIKNLPRRFMVRFVRFLPRLQDVIAAADVVVCRAGYNTINELLTAGKPALVIPERHPSREQERRAGLLPQDQFRVMEDFSDESMEAALLGLLGTKAKAGRHRFDRFRIGQCIVEDLKRLAVAG